MNDGKETDRDSFKLTIYFHSLQLSCGEEYFPEPVEITKLPNQGMRGISRFIFGKLWIIGIKYKGFEGNFGKLQFWESAMHVCGQLMYLADTAMNIGHHILIGQKDLAGECAPTGCWEKKACPLSSNISRELRKCFTSVPRSPTF